MAIDRKTLPGWRPAHPDRKIQSANDWYGFGFIAAVCGTRSGGAYHYYSKLAAYEQYCLGYKDGLELSQHTCCRRTVAGRAPAPRTGPGADITHPIFTHYKKR